MNIKKALLIVFPLFFFIGIAEILFAQNTKTYQSLEEIWFDIKSHNYALKSTAFQKELADMAYKASIGNVINPRIPVSINFTDYTKLQSNLIPSEFFNGEPGTFKQIQFGQQYSTTAVIQPQFDILNLSQIAQIKYSKLNQQYTDNQNLVLEKDLYDKVNSTYHNILTFQLQYEILKKNIAAAEQIKVIVQRKYEEGIIRKQDLNDAITNVINLKDNQEQLLKNLELQYQIMELFFENQVIPIIDDNAVLGTLDMPITAKTSTLTVQGLLIQSAMTRQEIKGLKYLYLPTLSFISSFNWQNLSNDYFLAHNSTGISFNNIGLRINWEFPTVQRLSNIKNKQIQLKVLSLNQKHAENEIETHKRQLQTELEKAQMQFMNFTEISALEEDSYQKYLLQYQENVLALDRLLTAQNKMLNSQLNTAIARVKKAYATQRIKINNQY